MKITCGKCPFNIERLEREVNILFISDLHYDINKKADKDTPGAKYMNTLLVESIKKADYDWEPDIVIIGGDLVNKGLAVNYPHYFNLIQKIITAYPNLRHTIFSTPGNHDVSRTDIMDMLPLIRKLHGKNARKSHTPNYMVGMFFTLSKRKLIKASPLRSTLLEYEAIYFETYLAQRIIMEAKLKIPAMEVNYPVRGLYTTYFTAVLGVNLVCHNSSFFCSLSQTVAGDRDNLFMIRDLITLVNKSLPKTGPVITFMHHPYHFLHESEYIAPLIPDNEHEYNNFSRILKSSDLVLSGHVHGDLQDPTYQQHHAYLVTNGTSYTTEKIEEKCYPFTYALLKINKQKNWFAMKKFIYEHSSKQYIMKPAPHPEQYHFNHRSLNGDFAETSIEAEKLRIIDYFLTISAEPVEERSYKFWIYQLGLYQPAFSLKKDTKLKAEDLYASGCKVVLIKEPKGSAAWIYKIEVMGYPAIEAVLKINQEDPVPPGAIVYFSVARSLVKLPNGEPDIQMVNSLSTDFKSLVLLSKKENVSINILYH